MRLGVFVGSFDPVHKGHIAITDYLLDEKIVDKLMVIATGNYWHKQNLTELEKRIDMLKLALREEVIVDEKYNEYPFSYQVLDAIEWDYPDCLIYFIIGADNARTLRKWKRYEELLKRTIIILGRDGIPIDIDIPNKIIIDRNFGDVSSTKIRENVDKNKNLLADSVYSYIKDNKLYKSRVRR